MDFWTPPRYPTLAFPEPNPERIRKLSGNALRANSELLRFVLLEIPKPWKIKHIPSQRSFRIVGWYPFLCWKGPLHGTSRAFPEILNSTGRTSDGGNLQGHRAIMGPNQLSCY